MADPLTLINIKTQRVAAHKPVIPEKKVASVAPETPAGGDSVQLESLSLRSTLKEQAGVLKTRASRNHRRRDSSLCGQ